MSINKFNTQRFSISFARILLRLVVACVAINGTTPLKFASALVCPCELMCIVATTTAHQITPIVP